MHVPIQISHDSDACMQTLRIIERPQEFESDAQTQGRPWHYAAFDQNMLISLVRTLRQAAVCRRDFMYAHLAHLQPATMHCCSRASNGFDGSSRRWQPSWFSMCSLCLQVASATLGVVVMPHWYKDVDADLIAQVHAVDPL